MKRKVTKTVMEEDEDFAMVDVSELRKACLLRKCFRFDE